MGRGAWDHYSSPAWGSAVRQEHPHLLAHTEAPWPFNLAHPSRQGKLNPRGPPFLGIAIVMNTPLLRLFQGQPLAGRFFTGNHFFTGICHLCLSLAKDQQESLSLEPGPLGHCWHPATPAKHTPQHGAVRQLASLSQSQCEDCGGHGALAGPRGLSSGQEQWEVSGSECSRGRAVLSGSRIRPRCSIYKTPFLPCFPWLPSRLRAGSTWALDP